MPRIRCRVVCAFGVVITIFCPSTALSKVDLPTLGLPNIFTKPALWVICGEFLEYLGAAVAKVKYFAKREFFLFIRSYLFVI